MIARRAETCWVDTEWTNCCGRLNLPVILVIYNTTGMNRPQIVRIFVSHCLYFIVVPKGIIVRCSLQNNQQMRRGSSIIYWCIPNFTPTCFSKSLPSSGGSYLPQKLPNQYLYCGCIRITTYPVWPVVEGCDPLDDGSELLKHVGVKFGIHQ
jgi:hypothetical protein